MTRRGQSRNGSAGTKLQAASDFIERHACEGITVHVVVAHTQGVSRQGFGRRFREWTGMTPNAKIRQRKLTCARQLLSDTQFSITAIAGACGYCDDTAFRKVFLRSEGVGPRAFRSLHQR